MDGATLAPLPHHTWFGFSFQVGPETTFEHAHRERTHTLAIGTGGAVDVRWFHRGGECAYHHGLNQIAFFAGDGELHTHVIRTAALPSSAYVLQLPRRHLDELLETDGSEPLHECRSFLPCDDAVLRQCLHRLASDTGREVAEDIGSEITARQLVLRLSDILGGKSPEWRDDNSFFAASEMKKILEYIDAHLGRHIGLGDIAPLCGLSPSHCARKFRHTEGLSLCRFINRRRVGAAMVALRTDDVPLANLALALGFSSQSHFTRLFSNLTGMTPAKFRREFRRTVG